MTAASSSPSGWRNRPNPNDDATSFCSSSFSAGRRRRAVNIRHVERRREEAVARLETYAAIERDIRRRHAEHPDLPYWLMTLSYGRHAVDAQISWCDETLSKLRDLDAVPEAIGDGAGQQQHP